MLRLKLNATTEKASAAYFELDILLMDIPEAKDLLLAIKNNLEDLSFLQLKLDETRDALGSIRSKAAEFINIYQDQKNHKWE